MWRLIPVNLFSWTQSISTISADKRCHLQMATSLSPAAWSIKMVVWCPSIPVHGKDSSFPDLNSLLHTCGSPISVSCMEHYTLPIDGMVFLHGMVYDRQGVHFWHWVFLSYPSIRLLLQCLNIFLCSFSPTPYLLSVSHVYTLRQSLQLQLPPPTQPYAKCHLHPVGSGEVDLPNEQCSQCLWRANLVFQEREGTIGPTGVEQEAKEEREGQ